jgi:hypothetical protein
VVKEGVDRGRERLAKVVLRHSRHAEGGVLYPDLALRVTSPRQQGEIFDLRSKKLNTEASTAEQMRAYRDANPDKQQVLKLGADAIREVIGGARNR